MFDWSVLLVALFIVVMLSPVAAAVIGWRVGRRQGRAQVQGWANGEPLGR